jgi:hypothetical protein
MIFSYEIPWLTHVILGAVMMFTCKDMDKPDNTANNISFLKQLLNSGNDYLTSDAVKYEKLIV